MCLRCRHAVTQSVAKSLADRGSKMRSTDPGQKVHMGYQSWTHSESSQAGEVPLSTWLSPTVHSGGVAQTSSVADKSSTPEPTSDCTHADCVAQSL